MSSTLPRLPRGPRGPLMGELRDTARVPQPGFGNPIPRDEAIRPFPRPPVGWDGSVAEWAIYWAHVEVDRGPEGELWFYQLPLGGGQRFSVDFLEDDLGVAIDVLSPGEVPAARHASLVLREAVMQGLGYTYIVIDDEVALTTPIWVLREALAGVSHSGQQA